LSERVFCDPRHRYNWVLCAKISLAAQQGIALNRKTSSLGDHGGSPLTADIGARRLLGVGLMLCLIGEVCLIAIRADREGAQGLAGLAILPMLAILAFYTFRHWQRCQVAWQQVASAVADETRARHAAETANLAKSRYLSTVSHEIRSPLNAIYGYAQLVERNDGAGAQEAAVVIRRCAEHITSLVEALLDISQVENGLIRVKPEPVRFDSFMDQIERMVRPLVS